MENTKENFRYDYQNALKDYMCIEFKKTRSELGFTQQQMAEILQMDPRSYRSLEKGEFACGALSLALYIVFCCSDISRLTNELQKLFSTIKNHVA